MKNISRRVFIKGMAVAAAATAASTVLAGCNFVPGNETENEETGFKPLQEVLEYDKAKKEDVTVSLNGYDFNTTSGLLALSCKIVNNTSSDLKLSGQESTNAIDIDAYLDAGTNPSVGGLKVVEGNFADNLAKSPVVTVASKEDDVTAGVREGKIYYVIDKDNKDWKTVTLVVELLNATGASKTAKFVINR